MKIAPDFWCLVIKGTEDECWLWKGYVKESLGYGEYCHEAAHRVAYRKTFGAIPTGKSIHHTCNNKLCMNPKHLTPLSAKEHFAVSPGGACGENKNKTHCKRGHPLSGNNLYLMPNGGRACKICRKREVRRFRSGLTFSLKRRFVMPKLTASKDEIRGLPPMIEGMLTVRLDGFSPKLSSKKDSVNLNPTMKVINHADYNDRVVFENLNTKGKWVWKDFCHAFGVPLVADGNGDFEFPGNFDGPEDQPDKWQYAGPLLGQQAQLYVVQADNTKGGIANKIKYYVCKVPGCTEKHSSNLVG